MKKKNNQFVFGQKPMAFKSRSKFDLSHQVKTMFNQGDLVPFLVQEVYPGDSFKIESTNVCRTSSPFIRPIMDNLFLDMYYFFVPNRLVYENWQNVMGENSEDYWSVELNSYCVPVIGGSVGVGTIADYFGLPLGEITSPVNILPFRAYAKIFNDWFRDENLQAPVLVNIDDTLGSINSNEWSVNNIFGKCAKINKLHDYFTTFLPEPQKGDPVTISLGTIAPVKTEVITARYNSGSNNPISFGPTGGFTGPLGVKTSGSNGIMSGASGSFTGTNDTLVPQNLYADLSNVESINVNDLRFAFQLQKMLEKDARGGTRYVEYLQEHFGVISPDARLQRSEFLGGKRMPLNIHQVAQTSGGSGDGENALAQVGAYSLSQGKCGCNKAFVEHGFIIGVMAVRQFHTYQQGVERFWRRKSRTDYYDPVFANIGEQPVYKTELFGLEEPDAIFGYNEAWADLRYRPSKITGALRSTAEQGFDIWHLGDNYGNAPTLGDSWIKETNTYLDRTLSVPSQNVPNFVIDIYNKMSAIRVLPTYSIPGLIDHN